ncbi:MAG: hypothetical protein ACHQHO_10790 [Solirubrobacterales bacterium]
MKLIKIAAAWIAVGSTLGAVSAAASAEPTPGGQPPYVSPLLAKELAVLTDRGVSPARAWQAIHVQNVTAQANLVGDAEAALAGGFGGAWFDAAAAQLHIGVTSSASRHTAERLVAQTGLSSDVTLTPVRSSWAQLLATQERWDRKLAKPFAAGAAQTGLDPGRNAVIVTVAPSLPASERAALARDAAADAVTVVLKIASSAPLKPTLMAETKCNKFVANEARCERSITSGVSIEKPVKITAKDKGNSHKNTTLDNFKEETIEKIEVGDSVEGPGIPAKTFVYAKPTTKSVTISNAATAAEVGVEFTFRASSLCSAGPQAIPKANKTQRDLLTAGHCMRREAESWSAYNTKGERGVIGPTGAFANGSKVGEEGATYCNGKCDGGDYGAILIEPEPGGVWQTGKANDPVFAVTAEWGKGTEKSYPVKGSRKPMAGQMNCHEGQTSGESCGKTTEEVNRTITFGAAPEPVIVVKGLVEDKGPELISLGGDSGGPFMFIEENNEVLMEGTLTGSVVPPAFNNPVWYYPLEKTLERLEMVLLTTDNEVIGKEGPFYKVEGKRLEAANEAATTKSKGNFVLKGVGISVTCKKVVAKAGATINASKGANSATSSETLELSECAVEGNGVPCEPEGAKITTNALTNTLAYDEKERTGHIDVLFKPTEGTQIANIKFAGAGCKIKETALEGSLAGDSFVEGNDAKLGAGKEVKVNEIRFPSKEKEVFVETAGKEEAKAPSLKAFGIAVTLEGTAEVEVGGKKWTAATE